MTKSLRLRLLTILAAVLIALLYLTPTLFEGQLPDWWGKYFPDEKLHIGLDLQGGAHLLLGVEAEKAIENAADRTVEDLENNLQEKRIKFLDIARLKENSSEITVELRNESDSEAFLQTLADSGLFADLMLLTGKTVKQNGGITYVLDFTDPRKDYIRKNAIDQAIETIRNRIDQFGVSEPVVQKHGADEILIQLPGLKDIKRAKELIGKTAQLQFKLLDEENSLTDAQKNGAPRGSEILSQKTIDPETKIPSTHYYLVKKKALLTGDYLKDARVSISTQAGGGA